MDVDKSFVSQVSFTNPCLPISWFHPSSPLTTNIKGCHLRFCFAVIANKIHHGSRLIYPKIESKTTNLQPPTI